MEEIRELVEKYALQNAVKYKAAPNAGAVMGKLLGEHVELRARAKELSPRKRCWKAWRRPAWKNGRRGFRP